eukprot:8450001-Pyramimonas_sp.AAC.1
MATGRSRTSSANPKHPPARDWPATSSKSWARHDRNGLALGPSRPTLVNSLSPQSPPPEHSPHNQQ